MGVAEIVSNAVNGMMSVVSGETEAICRDASSSTVANWREAQIAKATAIGAGAAAIPVVSYLTLPADVAATLRIMHRAATGICQIKLGHADDDTFASVLAVWSGAVVLDNNLAKQIAAKTLAAGGTTVGGAAGLKLAIKGFSLCASVMVAKKLGPKVAQKVASKIATKLAAKATTRWIPFISAVVGGGTNFWMVNGICEAADEYCDFITKHSR
jgi:hypothetical protein